MPERTIRYQPYSDSDHNYEPLLDFVRRHIPVVLQSPFELATEKSGYWSKEEPYDFSESGWQYGETAGIKVTLNEAYEPRAAGVAVSGVSVETFGLRSGHSIKIRCARYWYDPRYLELMVTGSKPAVDEVVAAFEREFGNAPPLTTEQVQRMLLNAEISVRAGAWDAAAMEANAVLKQKPDNGEAHFYADVALAAQGKYDMAEPHLARAVALNPTLYDAWYNLANVHLEQGEYEQAIERFRKSLELSPDNHPVFFRLGVALEKAGRTDEAITAYQDAVRTAPNPGQHFGYRGMDFEPQAKAALQRLQQ